jgi:hypothetical protein
VETKMQGKDNMPKKRRDGKGLAVSDSFLEEGK